MGDHPKYSNLEFAKDLWHFFKNYKKEFIFFSLILSIAFSLDLVPAIILAKIIDFFWTDYESLRIFYILLGIILGVEVFNTLTRHIGKYYLAIFTNKIQKHVKVESFEKVMEGDLLWNDRENTGIKVQKITEGELAVGRFMNFYINHGLPLIINLVGVIVIFSFFSIKYSLVAITFVIVYLFVEVKMNKEFARKTLEVKIASEESSGKVYEFSSNIHTVKSLGLEKSSNRQITEKEEKVFQTKKERRKANTKKWVTTGLVSTFFYTLFILLVGLDVSTGLLTVGSIIIYVDYVRRLRNQALGTISVQLGNLIDIKYGIFRMMGIYKEIPEINEENARNLRDWKEVKIEDVSFKYKEGGVLDGFSLSIKKGEKIGIVGKSGSGKSTFLKLLLKLYLPQKGNIYFDGKPIIRIKRDSIIKRVSYVPQETELFNLSLRENITISKSGRINVKSYKEALKVSKLDEVISKLKNKDLSLIGEKGYHLSGGERQRLGIARAIYKGSDIIILDEATSNLDYATERKIQEELDKLKNKTLIVSAHRLQTLKEMDKIIIIDKGKVVEQGTYDELLRKRGEFYKLWRKQGAWKSR
tara:strand:+ start:20156 stop:21910 length:1755 start_codon:yes stop_codon:yes gene_type:complete